MNANKDRDEAKTTLQRRLKRAMIVAVRLLCCSAILVCVIWLAALLYEDVQIEKTTKQTQALFGEDGTSPSPVPQETQSAPQETQSAPTETPRAQETYWPVTTLDAATGWGQEETLQTVMPELSPRPANVSRFEALYAENPDVIGWLWVGENISLPVVQRDNEYYLEHDFNGNSRDAGTLFLDEKNKIWPVDENLLVYGHNMRNGSMFGKMGDYRKLDYLKQHPMVRFQLIYEEEAFAYVVIAAFDCSATVTDPLYFKINRRNFADEAEYQAYLDEIAAWSIYDIPIDVNVQDDLLTLVTCSYNQGNGRFLVIARKIREGETEDGMKIAMQEASKR